MVEKLLDVRGLVCPIPITRISKTLKRIAVGEALEIVADDRGFDRDLRAWCFETGNRLLELQRSDGTCTARVLRGAGFHGAHWLAKVKFMLLGVRVHLSKALTYLMAHRRPGYLITFVSIAEGLRSHRFLKERNLTGYHLLPVPDEIYPYCGLVIGVSTKARAIQLFKVLREANFAVEDLRQVDKAKAYPKVALDINPP